MRIYLAGVIIILSLLGCKSQKETSENSSANSSPDTVVVVVEKPLLPKDSLIIGFEKTPCFGRCPVYKVRVYESGFATFEGLNFTEQLGMYATNFSQEEIARVFKSAEEVKYFSMEDKYDNPMVSDLPSTISYLRNEDQSKRIVARVNPPEDLKIFHKNLAVSLQEKDWKPYSER